ncbi:hypothetical protein U1Q18_016956, partial [Sarracenia purpurea var. burkii]
MGLFPKIDEVCSGWQHGVREFHRRRLRPSSPKSHASLFPDHHIMAPTGGTIVIVGFLYSISGPSSAAVCLEDPDRQQLNGPISVETAQRQSVAPTRQTQLGSGLSIRLRSAPTTQKFTRGKWRPQLLDFVSSLDESLVKSASQKKFQSLLDVSKAVTQLTVMKGVGPATASTVLAAHEPNLTPFMSDEAM